MSHISAMDEHASEATTDLDCLSYTLQRHVWLSLLACHTSFCWRRFYYSVSLLSVVLFMMGSTCYMAKYSARFEVDAYALRSWALGSLELTTDGAIVAGLAYIILSFLLWALHGLIAPKNGPKAKRRANEADITMTDITMQPMASPSSFNAQAKVNPLRCVYRRLVIT